MFFCNAVFSQSTSKICTLIRFTLFSNLWIFAWQDFPVLLPYRFTLFSNHSMWRKHTLLVLLPYRFTLFSNPPLYNWNCCLVLLPYRFTLFSNGINQWKTRYWFYYLIDLHYSQTTLINLFNSFVFYYLIDLHYSQTNSDGLVDFNGFTTL